MLYREHKWPDAPRQEPPFGAADLENARQHAVNWLVYIHMFSPFVTPEKCDENDKTFVELIADIQSTAASCAKQFEYFEDYWTLAIATSSKGYVEAAGEKAANHHSLALKIANDFCLTIWARVCAAEWLPSDPVRVAHEGVYSPIDPDLCIKHWKETVQAIQRYPEFDREAIEACIGREYAYALKEIERRTENKGGNSIQHVAVVPSSGNELPDPNNEVELLADARSKSGSVLLFGQGNSPIVRGKTKEPLTAAQYNVVNALIEAPDRGLTKDEIVSKSGHTDARGILERIASIDEGWRSVIVFPGAARSGYRIR